MHIDIKDRLNYTITPAWTVDRDLNLFDQWHAALYPPHTEVKLVRDLLGVKLTWLWKAGEIETY